MEQSNDLIKEIREAYAKEEGYPSFASMACNVNIVPRDISVIAKRYAEAVNVALRAKADRMEQALREIADFNCDYEDVNFKNLHSTECRACRAKELLESLEQEEEKKLTPEQITERKEAIEWYRNPEKEPVPQHGPVWVKAVERLPGWDQVAKWRHDTWEELPGMSTISDLTDNGFVTLDGMEWLDDSGIIVNQQVVVNVDDLMNFAEWAAEQAFFDDNYRLWELMGEGQAIDGKFRFTTKEFYELFKKEESEVEELKKQGVKHPNPRLCDNKSNCGYPSCACLPF